MKELVIQAWCDACETRTAATVSYTMAVDALVKELDLCEEHSKAVLEVVEFLERYGTPPEKAVAGARPSTKGPVPGSEYRVKGLDGKLVDRNEPSATTCPVCARPHSTRGAMRDHLKRAHRTNLSKLGLSVPRGRHAAAVRKAEEQAQQAASG